VLQAWPQLLPGRELLLRVDTGTGRGHHHHVRTAGVNSKFGVPLAELNEVRAAGPLRQVAASSACMRTPAVALFDIASWTETAEILCSAAPALPAGAHHQCRRRPSRLPERREQAALDLASFDAALGAIRARSPGIGVVARGPAATWVSAAGVLLARVTQTKSKEDTQLRRRGDRHELPDPGPRSTVPGTRS